MSVISFRFLDEMMTDNDKTFYKFLGERVSKLRKEHHLTQVQLAEILGISQQMMAAHELGTRKIPASMMPKLTKLFDVSFTEIFGETEKTAKRGPASALNRQVEQIRLLPRSKQKFVMEMLDTVIKQQG